MEMRRSDRAVTEIADLLAILDQCKVCRLAMTDGEAPYLVPLNYGYTWSEGLLTLYFHSARAGRKIDILKKTGVACFEVDCEHGLVEGDAACDYGFTFASVIGVGDVVFLEEKADKIYALNQLMRCQTGVDREYTYHDAHLANTAVYKLVVRDFSGKRKALPRVN
ncbi:MAG: pyridoxamine 5'-phosphate oxidase family protein [Fusobacteriaceae bacterium]|jgi:nitroimidazol reductase NimA-like FMN-containing flavoprotein (pyridoxamine 5'-phosphate oxidase superfamily)|nr:pyridoxamine 5'-phosphate oxidase family protein [Fusobacteriaceae bacterium]